MTADNKELTQGFSLKDKSCAVIGLGGLGTNVAVHLAGAGIGNGGSNIAVSAFVEVGYMLGSRTKIAGYAAILQIAVVPNHIALAHLVHSGAI